MLAKSKKSAIVMASVFFVACAASSWALTQAVEAPAAFLDLELIRNTPLGLTAVLGALFVALFAVMIYRFDESHFGLQGAIRWGLTGMLFVFIYTGLLLIQSRLDTPAVSVFEGLLPVLVVVVAYWLAFRVFPRTGEEVDDREG